MVVFEIFKLQSRRKYLLELFDKEIFSNALFYFAIKGEFLRIASSTL